MLLQLQLGENNEILRAKAHKINMDAPGFDIAAFSSDMLETMKKEKGVGLAAPQVGKSVRMVAVGSEKEPFIMINPEITYYSKDAAVESEGCLSLPGEEYPVERPKKIRFKYIDEHGNKVKRKAKGLLARVVQHEVDHLDGVLITDKIYEK